MRSETKIPVGGGETFPGVLALPEGKSPAHGRPGVIVLYELFGRASEMLEATDRLADAGYAALMPDLFAHGTRVVCLARAMTELVSGRPGRVAADFEAARRHLAERRDVDASCLAVIGFCMGRGFALAYAATRPEAAQAPSVNYGQVSLRRDALAKTYPIVASYGGRDLIYGPQGRLLAKNLEALGIEHDVKIYDDAGHSFMADGQHRLAQLAAVPMRLGYQAGSCGRR